MNPLKKTTRLSVRVFILLACASVVTPAFARTKPPSRKSAHTEILAVCRVETAPEEKVHRNRRHFLEFDVTIVSYARVPGDADADPELPVRQDGRIHVVHDLSCGGAAVTLVAGDTAEIRGEYVAVPNGGDLIHFTHPADGSCGTGGAHPGGSIRKVDPPPHS
jgi:hypothetical protein